MHEFGAATHSMCKVMNPFSEDHIAVSTHLIRGTCCALQTPTWRKGAGPACRPRHERRVVLGTSHIATCRTNKSPVPLDTTGNVVTDEVLHGKGPPRAIKIS